MKDRLAIDPGRVLITPEDGSAAYYATMTRADNPTQEGTPLNKATFLKDSTAAKFGLGDDAVPDDVFARIMSPQIIVNAPTGSTVTCKQGSEVLGAQYDSGEWVFIVPSFGDYEVTVTLPSGASGTTPVCVDMVARHYIAYRTNLYNEGDECESLTGGWSNYKNESTQTQTAIATFTANSDNMYSAGDNSYGIVGALNAIDLTDYSTILVDMTAGKGNNSSAWVGLVVMSAKNWCSTGTGCAAYKSVQSGTGSAERTIYELDVSSLTGTYYVSVQSYQKAFTIHNICLEQ